MSKTISFHHQPANLRWPLFAGILMDWQSAAFLSPLIAYGSAALSFNRIDILIEDKLRPRHAILIEIQREKTSSTQSWRNRHPYLPRSQ